VRHIGQLPDFHLQPLVTLSCPYCSRQYHLNYSDENWDKGGSLVRSSEAGDGPIP